MTYNRDIILNNTLEITVDSTQPAQETDSQVVLMPVQPFEYSLSYTCVLTPRIPTQKLRGDIVEFLYNAQQQTCVAYGWKLNTCSIQADFMQWSLTVSPHIAPSHFIQVITSNTSKLIFEEFQRLSRENPSRKFWAQGYLVMQGQRELSESLVTRFVNMSRRYQTL